MRTLSVALILFLTMSACGTPESEPAAVVAEDASMIRPDPANSAGNPELEVPPGWQARFDTDADYHIGSNADSSDVYFVTMTPGWHITTKPAGVFWHPASTATGSYKASTTIHLFQPGDRNEGYGLFFGGSNLEEADQAYLYFLLRRSGEFLVKRRAGENTESLIDWTANPAIVPFNEETTGTATNSMAVAVESDSVHFFVNDVEVAALAHDGLSTDGIVGLRVNHGLNLHTSGFAVEPLPATE